MELEKIRQSDNEVRWQHEEDVLECNSCKKTFQNRKEKVSFFFICKHCESVYLFYLLITIVSNYSSLLKIVFLFLVSL